MSSRSVALRQQLEASLGPAYTIERELGGGGMSRVFLATEIKFTRKVVIKVLSPELAAGLNVERFEREISLAAGLQQANIVPVITSGDANGLPWYSMPFVDGETLRERCRPERTEQPGLLPLADAIRILSDIARALAYAHERGIVHRDIKPENVLLSGGAAVVTDFGIAKALSASRTNAHTGTLTQAGTSLGTPAYMAPEQAAGDDVDHRADIYAWGVIAYELLAGRHPFASRTTSQQLIAAHMVEVPAPLSQRASIAQPIRDLVMRALAKDPTNRPQSAKEILEVLSGDRAHTAPTTSRVKITLLAAGLIGAAAIGASLMQSRATTVRTAEAAGPITLAVLPFDNEGSDEQAIFTNGLTDAVTAKLAALASLAVIDRRSASQYRKTPKPSKQIGAELGVRYLVEGVVRWARDAKGAWRAQVTPTLVDAASGNTRWTGEPILITPDDPFSAQSGIAARVADALQLALQPDDKARLARHLSTSPEAFAAYLRAKALTDNIGRTPISPADLQTAVTELERAVQLDPQFEEAWADLARAEYFRAVTSPTDRAAEARMRSTVARALAHAPGQPRLMLTIAWMRLGFDRDFSGLDSLVAQAVARAPNDAAVVATAGQLLAIRGQPDTAYALSRRAAVLDPRSALSLWSVGFAAASLRRWNDALHDADAILALDSADQRGWGLRFRVFQLQGYSAAMRREMDRAVAHVSRPDASLTAYMPYAGKEYASRFLLASARELDVHTLRDSIVSYLAPKADAALVLGDVARARAYYDTVRAVMGTRRVGGFAEVYVMLRLALAQAALGDVPSARATLDGVLASARARSVQSDLRVETEVVAAVYARLAEPDSAVRWLTTAVADHNGGWTARGFALLPSLGGLHGTPAFAAFMKAHPE